MSYPHDPFLFISLFYNYLFNHLINNVLGIYWRQTSILYTQ